MEFLSGTSELKLPRPWIHAWNCRGRFTEVVILGFRIPGTRTVQVGRTKWAKQWVTEVQIGYSWFKTVFGRDD